MEKAIRKYALQNAIKFNGTANPKALVGKIMGEFPEARANPKETMIKVNQITSEVNKLGVAAQTKELQELAPELLEKKVKVERDIFAFLNLTGKTNTAYPPGPEKYPHLGHAKASIANYELAKRTGGKFVLRFEDTNPKLVKNKFYEIIMDNLKWLGLEWDELVYASDHMDMFYEKAEIMIKKDKAYMCTCGPEQIKEGRADGNECNCRKQTVDQNYKQWKDFFKAKQGSGILRLKIDLSHKNSTMRDPTIFRIIDHPHARYKEQYRVWPNYDFQNAIMDSFSDIDMRIRSKEFEMRCELQRWVQKELNIKETSTYEIGRFNVEGVLSSGRVIREKVQSGELIGWDDPSLPTLVALKRRGFQPKAIKDFVMSTGFSKNEATVTWDDIIMHNKRLLDKEALRYFFIDDPIEIHIDGAPEIEVTLGLHPSDESKGFRKFQTNGKFLITKNDYEKLQDNDIVRLMDCLNFEFKNSEFTFHSQGHKEFKEASGKKIMHFLPVQDDLVDVEILMPDKKVVTGKSSPYANKIEEGQVIQFERFGFCRLDKSGEKKSFWFTH